MIHWLYKAYYRNTIDNCNREKAKPIIIIKKMFIVDISLHFFCKLFPRMCCTWLLVVSSPAATHVWSFLSLSLDFFPFLPIYHPFSLSILLRWLQHLCFLWIGLWDGWAAAVNLLPHQVLLMYKVEHIMVIEQERVMVHGIYILGPWVR